MRPTREQAWETLTRYTTSEALLRHALAVEASVGYYARLYGEDEEFWRATALLHDFDYEIHPTLDKHPQDGAPILREEGYPDELIDAVLSHAEHLAMPRDTQLKKVLFACDELSGFVHACGLVRPTGLDGLEPKSVKKKLKQPSFAAGVHRNEVYEGAELLGLELDEHIANVVAAMQPIAARARPQNGCRRDLGVALEEREDAIPGVLGSRRRTPRTCGRRSCAAHPRRRRPRARPLRPRAPSSKAASPRPGLPDRRRPEAPGSAPASRAARCIGPGEPSRPGPAGRRSRSRRQARGPMRMRATSCGRRSRSRP